MTAGVDMRAVRAALRALTLVNDALQTVPSPVKEYERTYGALPPPPGATAVLTAATSAVHPSTVRLAQPAAR
jgi:hypothetical protein